MFRQAFCGETSASTPVQAPFRSRRKSLTPRPRSSLCSILHRRPHPRRIPQPQLDSQLLQQPLEPRIVSASLHPHPHFLAEAIANRDAGTSHNPFGNRDGSPQCPAVAREDGGIVDGGRCPAVFPAEHRAARLRIHRGSLAGLSPESRVVEGARHMPGADESIPPGRWAAATRRE